MSGRRAKSNCLGNCNWMALWLLSSVGGRMLAVCRAAGDRVIGLLVSLPELGGLSVVKIGDAGGEGIGRS